MQKNLIDLQSCHVTQTTNNGDISDWVVLNENRDILYKLPKHWSEQDVMDAVHFARKFELIAFNAGIEFMKEKKQKEFDNFRISYDNTVDFLKEENEKLASILDGITTGEINPNDI